jgi:uncharacterized protein (DUF488 family)
MSTEKDPIFSIGHGNRTPDAFLTLLKNHGIEYLIDVRSQPYSKFNPHYNQNELKTFLENNGVKYVFMGDSIGGRPDRNKYKVCYHENDTVDYEAIRMQDFFKKGLDRLKTAYDKGVKVVMMCSESNPCECHRSKLIGRELDAMNIPLKHIDEKGKLKDQFTVILELNEGKNETNLFGETENMTSRKKYK